jgi:hypothetical protein
LRVEVTEDLDGLIVDTALEPDEPDDDTPELTTAALDPDAGPNPTC